MKRSHKTTISVKRPGRWALSLQLSLALLLLLAAPHRSAATPPTEPNASIIEGPLLSYEVIPSSSVGLYPDTPIVRLTVLIEDSSQVDERVDSLRGSIGTTLYLFSKEPVPFEVAGKRLRIETKRRGRLYWVDKIEVVI